MAEKHMQILTNLIKAVTNVTDLSSSRTTSNVSNSNEETSGVESAIKRLFPSTDQATHATVSNQSKARENGESSYGSHFEEGIPDRRPVSNITRFDPNSVYKPKSAKRAKSSTSKAPNAKKQRNTTASNERKSVKDVILLPGPKVSNVPKGVAREELFVRGFTTTFELSTFMSEEEIRTILEAKLKDKLGESWGPKFTFVRAVGNKIIAPQLSESECYDGKMIKHFSGQGPVYIRANKDISSLLIQWKRDATESSSDEDDDDALTCSTPVQTQLPTPSCNLITTSGAAQPSTSNASSHSLSNQRKVRCPTCRYSFPPEDIEVHADGCAEEKFGSFDENKYNELMMDSFDANNHGDIVCHQEPSAIVIDDDDGISNDELPLLTPENHKSKIIDAVTKLNTLVPEQKNRYHIRRKTVFDDYVNTRERSKWMEPENKLKVSFIGEPGLDGGGPRREFLTGTYCTYCSDYEYSML